jgi:ubiquinone/menaquinone biosynthesis C-methylase UbiE
MMPNYLRKLESCLLKKTEEARLHWYANIFNDMGTDWEAIVNARNTEIEADFIESLIGTKGVILDLCCGTARHSIALFKRRIRMVGMDLSANLLRIAKTRMNQAGVSFPLVRADMRFFPFRDKVFRAILSMFTSFGYLPSESEDALSFLEINRTLRRQGSFLLDIANRDHIVKTFRERDWAEFEPFFMLERRSIDFKESKLKSQWTLIQKKTGRVKHIEHVVRLYAFTRIEQLLSEAGLKVARVYGGYDKQEFTIDAPRMITLAKKTG